MIKHSSNLLRHNPGLVRDLLWVFFDIRRKQSVAVLIFRPVPAARESYGILKGSWSAQVGVFLIENGPTKSPSGSVNSMSISARIFKYVQFGNLISAVAARLSDLIPHEGFIFFVRP